MRSSGFRLSLAGIVLFFVGVVSLLVLPHAFAIVTTFVGGLMVWAGFIRTIFSYYSASGGAAK